MSRPRIKRKGPEPKRRELKLVDLKAIVEAAAAKHAPAGEIGP